MRVFLTGATGFIGSHVLRCLVAEGHEVHCLVRAESSMDRLSALNGTFERLEGDLYDIDRIRTITERLKPEAVIHLAWYAVPGRYWEAPENVACVRSSLSLVEQLIKVGCQRLIVAGTCAEYDWHDGYLSEDHTPCHPQSLYGVCKHSLRLMLEKYCTNMGLELAWPRFFFLYGPSENENRLASSVIRNLLDGKPGVCSAGDQIRDFLYVEDAASAICTILQSSLTGPVNVASGIPISVRDFVECVKSQVGGENRIEYGAISVDPKDPPVVVGDIQRLKSKTGWSPTVPLEVGIRKTVEWWKAKK